MSGITSFQPTIWAKELQRGLENKLVSGAICNHDYEGDASNAVAVKINTIGGLSATTYTPGTDIEYQTPSTEDTTLNINIMDIVPFELDDIVSAQTADGGRLMVKTMEEAGYCLANKQDAGVFAEVLDNGIASGATIGSDTAVAVDDADDAMSVITDLVTLADENNMPQDNRILVCPPRFINQLMKDPKISMALSMSKSNRTGDLGVGFEGELGGVLIYKSNNLKKSGDNFQVLLTHPKFNTVANQQNRVKTGDDKDSVGQWVQAYNVYGIKAVVAKSAKAIVSF